MVLKMDNIIKPSTNSIKKPNFIQISWKAPEFIFYKKSAWWYIVVVIVGLGLGALFYYLDNLLAIIAVLLTMIVLLIIGNQKPKEKNYTLTQNGIIIDNKETAYTDFKSYYVTYIENIATLHLEKAKKISAPITILLLNVNESQVIEIISKNLSENTKIKYSGGDVLSKWFRF